MAGSRLHKLVWIADTINREGHITFEALNSLWIEKELDGGRALSRNNFRNWCRDIWDLFHVEIRNEGRGEYRYYIANTPDIKYDRIRLWLWKNMSMSRTLAEAVDLKDRIILEDIPSGMTFLQDIVDAMKLGRRVRMTYKSYFSEDAATFVAEPYCVKLFRQRWYMVARSMRHGGMRIYSLDRIHSLSVTDEAFDMPKGWIADEFFADCYGIIHDNTMPEHIKLRVSAVQANYMRAVPIHKSQQETMTTEKFSEFSLHLRPTDDFIQEIFWNVDEVEVIAPQSLREKIAIMAKNICNKYK